tara:strand:- start:204 stop:341 length:138 start_codon:yes stop_codon:yes gene_type:complete
MSAKYFIETDGNLMPNVQSYEVIIEMTNVEYKFIGLPPWELNGAP